MIQFELVWVLPALGYALTLVLIRWVLLTKSKQPVSSVAWIMAIVMLPVIGGLLFLVFGINSLEKRASRKAQTSRVISRALPELSQYRLIPGEEHRPRQRRLMRLAYRVSESFPTLGNRVELLDDTTNTLAMIEQAIESAQETIHLEYYIWQPDTTGTQLRDLLIKKAKQGVTIRFLYDTIGSMRLSKKFLATMRNAGIQVAPFQPGNTFRQRWSVNFRNHRKIVIVDGKVGFTGGMNIGDEYLGKDPQLGHWRDTHLRLHGPVVRQLQQVFVEDWFYATDEELIQPRLFPPPDDFGKVAAQVIAGEPVGHTCAFHAIMFAAINEARDQIQLTTSYFVPPEPLMTALETAAQRGVRVRLMLAGKAAYHWTVLAGRSYYESLLKAGVEIYEYERGLLHTKTLTIDGDWSLVGTPNFDSRSLLLNFEVAVAAYDSKIAALLEDDFEMDLKDARKIIFKEWVTRSEWQVLQENVCRLFAPVL